MAVITGAMRRLVFENAINGVPIADIMVAFSLSELEARAAIAFVGKKIAEYRFRRMQPPLRYETPIDIALNRHALLEALTRLGDKYLDSSLIIPKVGVQGVASVPEAKEAARKVRAFQ